MDSVKKRNIVFWTENVPYAEDAEKNDIFSAQFWEKADKKRYQDETNFAELFSEILKPSLVSLEVGCGSGNDLRTFARHGLRVTGLDYSPENAYLTNVGLKSCKLPGRVISGDAECLPFPDASFDLVYSWGVLHHTPKTQQCVDEIYRVLRPGGKAVVMLYHKGYQYWYFLSTYIFLLKFMKKKLQDYISYGYDYAPLSQMFSRKELHSLFKKFTDVGVRVIAYPNTRYHPILKYVWKIFQFSPWLTQRFGSFGVIIAHKPGQSASIAEAPAPCCPLCHAELDYLVNEVKCKNPSCGALFPVHKGVMPMLHPNAQQVYKSFLEKNK